MASILMADHVVQRWVASVVNQAHLPEHGVARQRDIVTAACDMAINLVPTRLGPVLVVPDGEVGA